MGVVHTVTKEALSIDARRTENNVVQLGDITMWADKTD